MRPFGYLLSTAPFTADGKTTRFQVILFPMGEALPCEWRIWTRTTDGGKGHGNRWIEYNGDDPYALLSGTMLEYPPVVIPTTDTDVQHARTKGYPMNFCQKAYARAAQQTPSPTLSEAAWLPLIGGLLLADRPITPTKAPSHPKLVVVPAPKPMPEPAAPKPTPVVEVVEMPTNAIDAPGTKSDFGLMFVDPEDYTHYVPRAFAGVSERDVYDMARKAKKVVALRGPAGSGKSSSVYHYAGQTGDPICKVQGSIDANSETIFGAARPVPGTNRFAWTDGPMTRVARIGGIAYVNEANMLTPKIASYLMSMMQERHIVLAGNGGEVVKLHPNTLIIVDYNPGYRGTQNMNEALKDRMATPLWFDYDPTIEAQLIHSQTILKMAKNLRDMAKTGRLETPVSTRLLVNLYQWCKSPAGVDFALLLFVESFREAGPDELQTVKDALVGAWRDDITSDIRSR
jgi:nitric oxide reductase NorQ protein